MSIDPSELELPPGHFMTFWVVYDSPSDLIQHGKRYALRPQFTVRVQGAEPIIMASTKCWVADSLDEIRRLIPAGLHRMPRQAADDPVILETWF